MPRPGCFAPRKGPVPIVEGAGWVPGPVWMGMENLTPTRIRSPNRPARSESLYRLSYPGPRSAKEYEVYSLMGHVWLLLACSHSYLFYLCDSEVGKMFIVNRFVWKWTPDGSDEGTWSVFSDWKTHIVLESGSASASWWKSLPVSLEGRVRHSPIFLSNTASKISVLRFCSLFLRTCSWFGSICIWGRAV